MAWLCPVFMNMFIPEHPISELSGNIMHKPNIWQETTLNIYCLSIGKYRVKTFRFVVRNQYSVVQLVPALYIDIPFE